MSNNPFRYLRLRAAEALYAASPAVIITGSLLVLCAFAVLDYVTGPDIAFSILYIIPISVTAWFARRIPGMALSVCGALVMFVADGLHGQQHASLMIVGWNALVRLSFFLLTTWLLTLVHRKLENEERLASTDSLTGAANSREFYERVDAETERCRRYGRPFTLAYIDLDNFKTVNDTRGHAEGDKVLKAVAGCLKERIRRTDVLGRLGGDEFALLLPEIDEADARNAVSMIREHLLKAMEDGGWPVTASIGAVTYRTPPEDTAVAIRNADELMYRVKHGSKNGILYRTVE